MERDSTFVDLTHLIDENEKKKIIKIPEPIKQFCKDLCNLLIPLFIICSLIFGIIYIAIHI